MTNSKDFWRNKKIDPVSRSFSNTIDQAVGSVEGSEIFLTMYKALSVGPQVMLILNGFMLLCIIMLSLIIELTLILFNDVLKIKDDGNYGFKSDHLINGSNKLLIMLSIMFNAMLTHGFNPEDLLRSTIISTPTDNRNSINSSDNYRGISLSNSIWKLYDYVFIDLNMDYLKTDGMQSGLKK